jgi:tetrahydromethanopterin S-methyltransferase subunit F
LAKEDEILQDKEDEVEIIEEEKFEMTLSSVIDSFVHKTLDIEECANQFISMARKNHEDNAKRLVEDLKKASKILSTDADNTIGLKSIRKTVKEINRHSQSDLAATLEKSLFINLFSIFDTFIGDLIFVLYKNKPELYNSMHNTIQLSEALQYSSFEELKTVVLEKEWNVPYKLDTY